MTTAADVRRDLVNTLRLDLIGPRSGDPAHATYEREILPTAPSSWYLTGFLVPYEAPVEERSDDTGDDELDQASRLGAGDDEDPPEKASARRGYFPSSMGLSVLVPESTAQLQVIVSWGDYHPLDDESEIEPDERFGRHGWEREPRSQDLIVDLRNQSEPHPYEVPGSGGLQVVVSVQPVAGNYLQPGTRSVSVFLVNHRPPAAQGGQDTAWIFQPELTLKSLQPFVPRPNFRGQQSDDWDEKVADLQYRDVVEYAVGHNVSALALHPPGKPCREVRSSWMPEATVEKVVAAKTGGELGIETLGTAKDAAEIRQRIGPMVTEYGAWIAQQAVQGPKTGQQSEVTKELMSNAERARRRIEAGLQSLDDPDVFEAFRIANRAIARAIRQRICHDHPNKNPKALPPPAWRPFQLAFLLMNLPGMVDAEHPDRKVVDLLFFPTGGGKTEAYLGLAAFTLVLRRLRDPSIHSAGLSVLMRYTLRLLTLDQLGRAATLICALELERQDDVERLGKWPFEIGLWVGQSATPNQMGKKGDKNPYSARARTLAFMGDDRKPSPIPLEDCPWCGTKFTKDSFRLLPSTDTPQDLRVSCIHRRCDFYVRKQQDGLPILAVDDVIYRRLPAFMIATVDKFAGLPWVGETAGLFGRVDRYDKQGFYGPNQPGGRVLPPHPTRAGRPGLPPMDLVIQDELHLISGPLGTMVGLYETAIDALAADDFSGESPRPKIVASTATVRRAEKQIRALFGRTLVDIFPPPGPDRKDSFFARTVEPKEREPRLYLGLAAQGRNLKVVLLRSYLALLAATQKAWQQNGGTRNADNPADPYMTLLGYFNSLRELGGSRRIVEDEVQTRLVDYGFRRRRVGETKGLFADRKRLTEPRELTSRVSTNEVAETKRRLKLSAREKEHVDVALATNMISVGLDITRLGLMVVLGQPKTAAEYIQATSRVGRDDKRPGLVITLLNIHRPRDRSHYERFISWHESFYRAVEATSVTPFSPRAIDRGLAGVTVALARLGHSPMTAPKNAAAITDHRADLDFVSEIISRRAEGHDGDHQGANQKAEALRKHVRARVVDLLDTWERIATEKGDLQYQREEGGAVPPLLFTPLDPELARQSKMAQAFKAHRSLRDVEPAVPLWLRTPEGIDLEDEP